MPLFRAVVTFSLGVAACVWLPVFSPAFAADAGVGEALTKVVKLYGAGGFRGLEAYGTGFLASAEGHVVTSWGPLLDAEPVTAVLDDGRRFEAKLIGVDPGLGLAVLKLNGADGTLPYFDLAEAADAVPGDRVFALSNMFRVAAGDEPVSVMHGIVLARTPLSARRGSFNVIFDEPVYVIDAVTNNPGAAGGVVVSRDGRLVGMIGRELRGEGTETWINYALPAAAIRTRFEAIAAGSEVPSEHPAGGEMVKRRPVDVGIVMVPDVTARTPAYVTDVLPDSAAEAAGVRRDDLVLFAAGRPVRSIRELTDVLSKAESGDEVDLVVRRAGRLEPLRIMVP
jgi:serine protease Do